MLISVQINGGKSILNVTGCGNVSENLKTCEKSSETDLLYLFLLENAKKKNFVEKPQNVQKWIKSISKCFYDQHEYDGRHDDGCEHDGGLNKENLGRQKAQQTTDHCHLKKEKNSTTRNERMGQPGRVELDGQVERVGRDGRDGRDG